MRLLHMLCILMSILLIKSSNYANQNNAGSNEEHSKEINVALINQTEELNTPANNYNNNVDALAITVNEENENHHVENNAGTVSSIVQCSKGTFKFLVTISNLALPAFLTLENALPMVNVQFRFRGSTDLRVSIPILIINIALLVNQTPNIILSPIHQALVPIIPALLELSRWVRLRFKGEANYDPNKNLEEEFKYIPRCHKFAVWLGELMLIILPSYAPQNIFIPLLVFNVTEWPIIMPYRDWETTALSFAQFYSATMVPFTEGFNPLQYLIAFVICIITIIFRSFLIERKRANGAFNDN